MQRGLSWNPSAVNMWRWWRRECGEVIGEFMYYIDSTSFMNIVLTVILGTGVLLIVISLSVAGSRRKTGRNGTSYLYMFAILFGCFGLVITGLGVRGQKSGN